MSAAMAEAAALDPSVVTPVYAVSSFQPRRMRKMITMVHRGASVLTLDRELSYAKRVQHDVQQAVELALAMPEAAQLPVAVAVAVVAVMVVILANPRPVLRPPAPQPRRVPQPQPLVRRRNQRPASTTWMTTSRSDPLLRR